MFWECGFRRAEFNPKCAAKAARPDDWRMNDAAAFVGAYPAWRWLPPALAFSSLHCSQMLLRPCLFLCPQQNPSSIVRMHGYARFLRNPLQTKARRNHHSDL